MPVERAQVLRLAQVSQAFIFYSFLPCSRLGCAENAVCGLEQGAGLHVKPGFPAVVLNAPRFNAALAQFGDADSPFHFHFFLDWRPGP